MLLLSPLLEAWWSFSQEPGWEIRCRCLPVPCMETPVGLLAVSITVCTTRTVRLALCSSYSWGKGCCSCLSRNTIIHCSLVCDTSPSSSATSRGRAACHSLMMHNRKACLPLDLVRSTGPLSVVRCLYAWKSLLWWFHSSGICLNHEICSEDLRGGHFAFFSLSTPWSSSCWRSCWLLSLASLKWQVESQYSFRMPHDVIMHKKSRDTSLSSLRGTSWHHWYRDPLTLDSFRKRETDSRGEKSSWSGVSQVPAGTQCPLSHWVALWFSFLF